MNSTDAANSNAGALVTLSHSAASTDLPTGNLYSEEPPVDSELHLRQLILLLTCLDRLWRNRTDYYAAADMSVYYSPTRTKARDFRGPDFFVVLDTEKRQRNSWTVWEEGKYPDLIVEILSDTTADEDRGPKKELYQNTFGTSEYFWFDPKSLEFAGFRLVNGTYAAIAATPDSWRWSEQLQLFLGVREGKLRYFTPDGELVLTPDEAEIASEAERVRERNRAETEARERARAEAEATRLRERLRALGIDPDEV